MTGDARRVTPQDRAGWVQALRARLHTPSGTPNLLDAVLEIAAPEYPSLREDLLHGQLDAWARQARQHLVDLERPESTAAVLAGVVHVLFREAGFKGNREDYGDPRNSFLNEVVERRTGLPITLSVLFVEVARRAGLQAHGVAFPGHFLARVDDPREEGTFVIVDAFSGGTILGLAELKELLKKQTASQLRLSPKMLGPAAVELVVLRMLRNLKASYSERDDFPRALLAQERLMLVTGDTPEEIRDHGLLLAGAQEPGAAVTELKRYLQASPQAEDSQDIQHTILTLEHHGYNVQ